MVRRCVPKVENEGILIHCHSSPYEGLFEATKMSQKVLQSGFYWPTLFKDCLPLLKVMTDVNGLVTSKGGMRCP